MRDSEAVKKSASTREEKRATRFRGEMRNDLVDLAIAHIEGRIRASAMARVLCGDGSR